MARTLLALSASSKPETLNYAIEQADHNDLFDLSEIDALLQAHPGARGAKRLKQALTDYRPTPVWTRSDLEADFFRLIQSHDLPTPSVNVWIAGHEVDLVYEDQKLVIELDGGKYHETTAARERDPRRDADLQLAHYAVLRITGKRLANDPKGVVKIVREMLARKR